MTLYLDPSYDSKNFRSEFRFPQQNGVYKSDMRLLNVGVEKTDAGDTSYNILCGAGGCISSMALYSGSQLIDQVLHFSEYVALKNLLHPNDENQSLHRPLKRNKLGYVSAGLDTISGGVVSNGVVQSNQVPNKFNVVYGSGATALQKPQNGAWIDLSDCFGFLRSSPYVPMNVYPDFRLVVNYKNSAKLAEIVKDRTATLSTLEPLVVCEYETNPEKADALMRTYQGVSFECVEHDQVQLTNPAPAINTTTNQSQSYVLKGFNDKFISKVCVVNTPTEQSTWDTSNVNSSMSNQSSVSQLDYSYQCRINGQNWFPVANYSGKNRRMGQMTDAWGNMNVAWGQNLCANKDGAGEVFISGAEDTIGQVDFSGWRIDDVIKEFKITVNRTAVGGTTADATDNLNLRQALHLNFFGISRKRCVPSGNGILVQYV